MNINFRHFTLLSGYHVNYEQAWQDLILIDKRFTQHSQTDEKRFPSAIIKIYIKEIYKKIQDGGKEI